MDQEKKYKFYKECDGIFIPSVFPEDALRSATNYKPKNGDIFIATYPKCGTTWMHYLVLLILRYGKVSDDPLDFFLGCPFIEMIGAESIDYMIQPGAIKTHLPYDKVPQSKDAKYIYVCRNPKDCVVSFYHHIKIAKGISPFAQNLSFDEFFEYFIRGEVPFGDYFDHINAWYEHRNDPNIYLVTYENLKKDIRGEVLKLARFLGEEYYEAIVNDSQILDKVIHYSSFDYIKKDTNKIMLKFIEGEIAPHFGGRKIPVGLVNVIEAMKIRKVTSDTPLEFVRKGIVGDWKNHLSHSQLRRLEEQTIEKTVNSDVMNLWS